MTVNTYMKIKGVKERASQVQICHVTFLYYLENIMSRNETINFDLLVHSDEKSGSEMRERYCYEIFFKEFYYLRSNRKRGGDKI